MSGLGRRLGIDLGVMADALPDALVIIDSNSEIVFVNTHAETLFGSARSDMVGKPLDSLIPGPLREVHRGHVANWNAAIGTRAMGDDIRADLVGLRSDGTQFPAEISLGPITTENGNFVGAIVRDVAERRRLERAAATETARSEFFASVSHELRTPLTSILGFCELLAESDDLSEAREFARIIQRNAAREQRIIADLLFLTSIDDFARDSLMVDVDLVGLVSDAVNASGPAAASAGVAVGWVRPDHQILVHVDPIHLGQVVDNLLSNALKFSPAGAAVQVDITANATTAAVRVRDSGPGVTPEEAPHIFERLYRGDFARRHEIPGAGLGLAIAKGIVETFDGSICLEPHAGCGALFRLDVPLASVLIYAPLGARELSACQC